VRATARAGTAPFLVPGERDRWSADDSRSWTIVLGGLGTATAIAMIAAYWPFTVDDTFITLRYADHLARGLGATWNPGSPPAEGYSSPLWLSVIAIAQRATLDPLLAAKGLGAALALASLALVAVLVDRMLSDRADAERRLASAMAVFVLGCAPSTAIHAVSGMETALTTFLSAAYALAVVSLLAFAAPHERDRAVPRRRAAGVAAIGLLFGLARPEANLLVIVASIAMLVRLEGPARRDLAIAIAVLHALPGAIYFAWRWSYYGLPLPLPFYVKALLPESTLPGASEALAFARHHLIERLDLGIALVAGIALTARRPASPIPALLGGAAIWVFLFVPAHEMGYDFRYFQPLMPIVAAMVGAGIVALRARAGAMAPIVPAIVVLASVASTAPGLSRSLAEKHAYARGIETAHRAIGDALGAVRERIDRPVLAALDVGAIAYRSRWTVIDTWGLNEPEIALGARRDAAAILARDPEVVIVVSSTPDRFVPHFEHERALWKGARARGYVEAGRFEFLPDYHLFTLARAEGVAHGALRRARLAIETRAQRVAM
jgi:arabinofuranosyltransferase